MNGKLPSMFACFLPYRDSRRLNMGKKIGGKILPRDSKRMRPVRIFWDFGSTRITIPFKVPNIWIAHSCLLVQNSESKCYSNKCRLRGSDGRHKSSGKFAFFFREESPWWSKISKSLI
jgi:hypothetical protein